MHRVRLFCWLGLHDWMPWETFGIRGYEGYKVRRCWNGYCTAIQKRKASHA